MSVNIEGKNTEYSQQTSIVITANQKIQEKRIKILDDKIVQINPATFLPNSIRAMEMPLSPSSSIGDLSPKNSK